MDASTFDGLRDRQWPNSQPVPSAAWKCGYCNREIASAIGFATTDGAGRPAYIRFCSFCNGPTFFVPGSGDYSPVALAGGVVPHVPLELAALFHEARAAAAAGAPTAAAMACRKMLMHIGVEKGAPANQTFAAYVTYLGDNHFIPPNGQAWVDYVRTRGNDANHEITLLSAEDATALITFVEMLLRFIYEMPQLVPQPPAPHTPGP